MIEFFVGIAVALALWVFGMHFMPDMPNNYPGKHPIQQELIKNKTKEEEE
jgi:hypothetical protein